MKSLLSLVFITLLPCVFAQSDVGAHFYLNGKMQDHAMVKPGAPTTLEIEIFDQETKEVFKEFKIMHGKIMHMVILKSDLSSFKHVHPYFDPVTGRFFISLNTPYQDPDNFDSQNIFAEAGMYMIMADVVVKGVGMRMLHYHMMVSGADEKKSLTIDPVESDGSILKTFDFGTDRFYRAHLKFEQISGCGGNLVEFQLNLQKKIDHEFQDIQTIEPWLGVGGHSVVVSEGFMKGPMGTFDMAMGHMHAPGIGLDELPLTSKFIFSLFDNGRLIPGPQKIWMQVKDQGKVLKLPFIFDYQPLSMTEC